MIKYQELKAELIEIAKILHEFPEQLQPKIFELLTKAYLKEIGMEVNLLPESSPTENGQNEIAIDGKQKDDLKAKRKQVPYRESYSIVKDLDLRAADGHPSFIDFCNSKKVNTAINLNTVAVYYLKNIKKVEHVTMDHIYTCYKEISSTKLGKLLQSIKDTSGSRYGFIDATDLNNITLSLRGETLVEHKINQKQLSNGNMTAKEKNNEKVVSEV